MPLTTPLNSRSLGWANFCPLSKLNKSIFSFGKANQHNPNLVFKSKIFAGALFKRVHWYKKHSFCSSESIFGFGFPRRIQERLSLEAPLTLWAEYEKTQSIGAMYEQRNISPVCLLWLRQSQCDKNGKLFPISLVQSSKPCLHKNGKISTNETTGTTCNRKH